MLWLALFRFLAFMLWCGVLLFPAVSRVSTIVRVLSVVDIPAVAGVPSVFCTLAIVRVGGREGWREEGKGGGAKKGFRERTLEGIIYPFDVPPQWEFIGIFLPSH